MRPLDPALLPGNVPRLHAHMMLLGFALMTIYGVGLHMLPRFTGNPVRPGALPWIQLALLHAGLWAFVAGAWAGADRLAAAGGGLLWLSLLIYSIRVLPVLWPRGGPRRRVVPVAEIASKP